MLCLICGPNIPIFYCCMHAEEKLRVLTCLGNHLIISIIYAFSTSRLEYRSITIQSMKFGIIVKNNHKLNFPLTRPTYLICMSFTTLVFVYIVLRAFYVPPFSDEVTTFFFYIQPGKFQPFY